MTDRLTAYLRGPCGQPGAKPFCPEDVAWLRREIPRLRDVGDDRVDELYTQWSNGYWDAGWLRLNATAVRLFGRWLEEEVGDDWTRFVPWSGPEEGRAAESGDQAVTAGPVLAEEGR